MPEGHNGDICLEVVRAAGVALTGASAEAPGGGWAKVLISLAYPAEVNQASHTNS